MARGYMGRVLLVDLSNSRLEDEVFPDDTWREFIGGYGVGARLLYSRQKARVDPLGPESTFAFVTGPLTGTAALGGCRYTVVGKSPLTGCWGDANSAAISAPISSLPATTRSSLPEDRKSLSISFSLTMQPS